MEKGREENDGIIVNRHHLVPKSRNGTSNEANIIKVNEKDHRTRHLRCGNDTPTEAICREVWSENFKADLLNVLDNYLNKYYEKKTHKGMIRSEVERVLNLEDKLW